ncbi:hypothetical protein DFQ26_004621 [Actinomortierella ambigua]|nr:hypothetical protein DFQ26_004621 [Actinomortierella ambigua]
MNSPAKAAATVQNDILLVQYSPTGTGVGDLYAILLSNTNQPLTFQIQRQIPDLQASKSAVASMTLASVPSFVDSNPTTPGTSPPAPPGSSPASAAVVAAPPFRDVVLSVNAASSSQVWHVKAPGRGVPPGATHDNPLAPLWGASKMLLSLFPDAISIGLGTHTPLSPKSPGILAVLQTSTGAQLTKLEYPRGSVNLGSPTPPSNTTSAEQQVQWKQSWNGPTPLTLWSNSPSQPELVFHPTTVLTSGEFSEAVVASDELVAVAGDKIYVNKFAPIWDPVNPTNNAPKINGSIVACTTSKKVVVVIVPGSDGTQSRPDIHLFDLKTASWAKSQLVPALPGTFSDIPPIPPPPGNSSRPDKGDPDKGGSSPSDDPSTSDPSSASRSTSRAGLIGGIVGGIVVLGVLIFVGFFFRRRRSSRQKDHHQGGFAPKPLDRNDCPQKQQRMHDGERSGRGDEASLEANDRREKARPSAGNPHEMVSSQAQMTARPWTNNPHVITYPPTFNQHETSAFSQAGSPQETIQQRIINSQDMNWSPANSHRRTASSRADSPRKSTRSRVNGPHEVTRVATLPAVHRTNNPQYDPNQQL